MRVSASANRLLFALPNTTKRLQEWQLTSPLRILVKSDSIMLNGDDIESRMAHDIIIASTEVVKDASATFQNHNPDPGSCSSDSPSTTEFLGPDANENLTNEKQCKLVKVKVGPEHFDLLHKIGEGAFGKVLLVRNKINNNYYAMKVISKKLLRKKNNIQYMKSERDILTKIDHPFVVSLYFAFQTESKIFLVMDFLAGGELFYHLRKRGIILEAEARVYFAEMILAIEFLHSINVIHRDLKPENVLLRPNGHICLTDFGLAKEIGDGVTTRTLCGTSEYMAPEMLTRNGYGKAVDWWSLGALFYEVMAGKPPFQSKNQKDLDRKILSERLSLPSYLSTEAHSLLKGMLERDVNKRLGAAKSTMFSIGGVAALKQHAFFKGLDFLDVLYGYIAPPIDLGFGGGDLQASHDASNPNVTNANYIAHFYPEFTQQSISPSVLEDCHSNVTSVVNTPFARSRANSGQRLDPPAADGSIAVRPDEFAGFEYSWEQLECSEEAYLKMEEEINAKLAKVQKKRLARLKKEEDRAGKMAIQLAQSKAAEEEARQKKLQSDMQRARDEEMKAKMRSLELQLTTQNELLKASITECNTLRDTSEGLARNIDRIQKKLKATRKKLRDISDLEAKGGEMTVEQKAKLARKSELEQEANELERELAGLGSSADLEAKVSEVEDRCVAVTKMISELTSELDHIRCSMNPGSPLTTSSSSAAVLCTPPTTPPSVANLHMETRQEKGTYAAKSTKDEKFKPDLDLSDHQRITDQATTSKLTRSAVTKEDSSSIVASTDHQTHDTYLDTSQLTRSLEQELKKQQENFNILASESHNAHVALQSHISNKDAIQKKLKATRKKLRDISDLEAKGGEMTVEQKAKLARKSELEQEANELERELAGLGSSADLEAKVSEVEDRCVAVTKMISELTAQIGCLAVSEVPSCAPIDNITGEGNRSLDCSNQESHVNSHDGAVPVLDVRATKSSPAITLVTASADVVSSEAQAHNGSASEATLVQLPSQDPTNVLLKPVTKSSALPTHAAWGAASKKAPTTSMK